MSTARPYDSINMALIVDLFPLIEALATPSVSSPRGQRAVTIPASLVRGIVVSWGIPVPLHASFAEESHPQSRLRQGGDAKAKD